MELMIELREFLRRADIKVVKQFLPNIARYLQNATNLLLTK
jgi:hypothetical protein